MNKKTSWITVIFDKTLSYCLDNDNIKYNRRWLTISYLEHLIIGIVIILNSLLLVVHGINSNMLDWHPIIYLNPKIHIYPPINPYQPIISLYSIITTKTISSSQIAILKISKLSQTIQSHTNKTFKSTSHHIDKPKPKISIL